MLKIRGDKVVKIWVDDVRPAPDGWVWCKTTNETLRKIIVDKVKVDIISLDHDAGEDNFGGDFINILNEFERLEHNQKFKVDFPIHIHSANPVGVENMRRIIKHNNWREK